MASESTEGAESETAVTVDLPADLEEWLDAEAADVGVDRETLLLQVLASYRATSRLDGDSPVEEWPAEPDLEAAVDDHLETDIEARVDDRVEAAVAERVEATEERLGARVDGVEADFQDKIEDVRERVIQVKQEADAKAPADHDHEEFERFVALERRFEDLEEDVEALRERVEVALPEQAEAVEDVEEELAQIRDRLQTVGWVVSDLRDAVESGDGMEAVDRIKRAAAKEDVSRARCESCGAGVEIGLLTDPNCPHCDATVTDVEGATGFFDKPRLLVASQLESGDRE